MGYLAGHRYSRTMQPGVDNRAADNQGKSWGFCCATIVCSFLISMRQGWFPESIHRAGYEAEKARIKQDEKRIIAQRKQSILSMKKIQQYKQTILMTCNS